MAESDVTPATIKALHDKCGLPIMQCRQALEAHGGAVDPTLLALIRAGVVTSDQLNPHLCSDDLFAEAELADTKKVMDKAAGHPEAMDIAGLVTQAMDQPGMREAMGARARAQALVAKKRKAREQDGDLESGCTGDEEHGPGVPTHGGRIVSAGGADESFNGGGAEADGGAPIEEQR